MPRASYITKYLDLCDKIGREWVTGPLSHQELKAMRFVKFALLKRQSSLKKDPPSCSNILKEMSHWRCSIQGQVNAENIVKFHHGEGGWQNTRTGLRSWNARSVKGRISMIIATPDCLRSLTCCVLTPPVRITHDRFRVSSSFSTEYDSSYIWWVPCVGR